MGKEVQGAVALAIFLQGKERRNVLKRQHMDKCSKVGALRGAGRGALILRGARGAGQRPPAPLPTLPSGGADRLVGCRYAAAAR